MSVTDPSSRIRIARQPDPGAAVRPPAPTPAPDKVVAVGRRPSPLLSPAIIKQLQAVVGNRSVNRLIAASPAAQRATADDDIEPATEREPLTGAQVAEAIGYTKKRFGVASQMVI